MNVLINAIHEGKNHFALIPFEKLKDYDLNTLDERSDQDRDQEISDPIAWIFDRLGITPFTPYLTKDEKEKIFMEDKNFIEPDFSSAQDLKQYLNPKPPFTVDKIITIYSIN